MKAVKTRLKTISWLLSALLLLQSCVVYHNTSTTLDRASQDQIKTKITYTNGEISRYKYITYEHGTYFGVTKNSGELVKFPLSEQQIYEVYLQNKSTSSILTIVAFAPVAFVLFGIIYCASGGNCVDISG